MDYLPRRVLGRVKRILFLLAFALLSPASQAGTRAGPPVALVTAESLDQLIAIDLPSGRIVQRLRLPADPENVVTSGRLAVVVSARAGAVTLLAPGSLRVQRVIYGFGAPHIAAFSPDLEQVYVTDDARGQLSVISLARARVIRKLFVGYGAHHLSVSPDGKETWIALGERAHTIVVLDTSRPALPRVVGRLRLAWAPTIWPSRRTAAVCGSHRTRASASASSTPGRDVCSSRSPRARRHNTLPSAGSHS
jgi:hypothetical protein